MTVSVVRNTGLCILELIKFSVETLGSGHEQSLGLSSDHEACLTPSRLPLASVKVNYEKSPKFVTRDHCIVYVVSILTFSKMTPYDCCEQWAWVYNLWISIKLIFNFPDWHNLAVWMLYEFLSIYISMITQKQLVWSTCSAHKLSHQSDCLGDVNP